MMRRRIMNELAPSTRADSGSSFGIVSKTPRMMKMLTARASVWYGRISPQVELISPSRSWISQIEIRPVTRLGTKSDATRIASTSRLPGVGRWTSA